MNNGTREELIPLTQDPKRNPKANDDDYLDEEHSAEDRQDALVDEQGEESFPASDPPANY